MLWVSRSSDSQKPEKKYAVRPTASPAQSFVADSHHQTGPAAIAVTTVILSCVLPLGTEVVPI